MIYMTKNPERSTREPTAGSPTAVIDRAFVADLIESIGYADYLEIVGDLPEEVDDQIRSLLSKMETGQVAGIKHAVHKIAGLMSQFGAVQVSVVADDVNDADSAAEILELVTKLIGAARAALVELENIGRERALAQT